MRDTLFFWRDVPMDVDLGSFEYIAKKWEGKIIVICFSDYPEERKICGWSYEELDNVQNIVVENIQNSDEYLKRLIESNLSAIHIFNGIRGKKQQYLDFYIKTSTVLKFGIISERPSLYGKTIILAAKKLAFNILYGYLNFKYGKSIGCFLPLGEIGVKTYQGYGWKKHIFFPYMYNPRLQEVTKQKKCTDRLKFLYIGRFDADAKGVDVLIQAVNCLPKNGRWSLDMVGGYGAISDKVIHWCEINDKVNFLGSWKSKDVCDKMCEYDVCLVPSKYDGWNLTPNQAIHCGLGTIITNQAGSDELIKYSGAGLVIKANSVNALLKAMNFAIKNRSEVEIWKENACKYREKISSKVVGEYFIEIMDFTFKKEGKRPICPWII